MTTYPVNNNDGLKVVLLILLILFALAIGKCNAQVLFGTGATSDGRTSYKLGYVKTVGVYTNIYADYHFYSDNHSPNVTTDIERPAVMFGPMIRLNVYPEIILYSGVGKWKKHESKNDCYGDRYYVNTSGTCVEFGFMAKIIARGLFSLYLDASLNSTQTFNTMVVCYLSIL